MMNRKLTLVVAFAGATVGLSATSQLHAQNLVPDPGFKQADFSPEAAIENKTTWLWYQIVAPSEATLDKAKGAVTMKGGKTFLHSSRFKVAAGKSYHVAVKAQGTGKVSLEYLWWTADGGMTKPHRTIPVKQAELKDATQALEGADKAPEGAAEAYIRIVVEEGTVTISEPNVTTK